MRWFSAPVQSEQVNNTRVSLFASERSWRAGQDAPSVFTIASQFSRLFDAIAFTAATNKEF